MRVGEDDIGWMDSLFPMYSPMGIGKGEEEGCYCRCRLAELRNLGLGLGTSGFDLLGGSWLTGL